MVKETSAVRGELTDADLKVMITRYKKRGLNTTQIMERLAGRYSCSDMLSKLAGDRYIVRTIIKEQLVALDADNNFSEHDGIMLLNDLIESIK